MHLLHLHLSHLHMYALVANQFSTTFAAYLMSDLSLIILQRRPLKNRSESPRRQSDRKPEARQRPTNLEESLTKERVTRRRKKRSRKDQKSKFVKVIVINNSMINYGHLLSYCHTLIGKNVIYYRKTVYNDAHDANVWTPTSPIAKVSAKKTLEKNFAEK